MGPDVEKYGDIENLPAGSGSRQERLVNCRTKVCDCCGEEWEEEFFCEKCSGVHDHGETEMVPNIFWDGNPGDEYVIEDVEPMHEDICMNCCNCRGS